MKKIFILITLGLYQPDTTSCNYIPTSSIEKIAISSESINIYPNPTNSILNVQVTDLAYAELRFSTPLEMTICDVLGNEVIPKSKIVNQKCTLDVSGLTPGVYFVRIGSATQKFMKE